MTNTHDPRLGEMGIPLACGGPLCGIDHHHPLCKLATAPAAPVAAQPDITQQTLDDVKAGIPARDAEIAALRKENEALKATASAEPVAVPKCPFHCGWGGLHKIAVQDAAYLAKVQWPEDEEGVSVPRATAMRSMDYLIQVCRTMLNAAPVAAQAQQPVSGADGGDLTVKESLTTAEPVKGPSDDLCAALEECRLALEPYDDIKPRDWKTDRERLRRAHQTVRASLAQQDADKAAGLVREPVNGEGWNVHWWNESMRLMLPDGSRIRHANIFKNGTMVITIKTDAARKEAVNG